MDEKCVLCKEMGCVKREGAVGGEGWGRTEDFTEIAGCFGTRVASHALLQPKGELCSGQHRLIC